MCTNVAKRFKMKINNQKNQKDDITHLQATLADVCGRIEAPGCCCGMWVPAHLSINDLYCRYTWKVTEDHVNK